MGAPGEARHRLRSHLGNSAGAGLSAVGVAEPATTQKGIDVTDSQLIHISTSADDAFNAFDFSQFEGKSVRIYVAGFG